MLTGEKAPRKWNRVGLSRMPVCDYGKHRWEREAPTYEGMGVEEEARERFIDEIVDRLHDRIAPVLTELAHKNESGIIVGQYKIGRYMRQWHRDIDIGSGIGIQYTTPVAVGALVRDHGFPANKNPKGNWWVTKTAIDRWMHDRGMLMRKLRELECKPAKGRHGVNGYAPPEYYKQEDLARATREILKDSVKASL